MIVAITGVIGLFNQSAQAWPGNKIGKAIHDAAHHVNEERKSIQKRVGGHARQFGSALKQRRFGLAGESLGHLANDLAPSAGAPIISIAHGGEGATREGKAANRAAHNGQWGPVVGHIGQAAIQAGTGIAPVSPQVGALIISGGEEVKTAAKKGQNLNAEAHKAIHRLIRK